jgi:hypothetical protein
MRKAYTILDGKLQWKGPLERHKLQWENIIKIGLNEIGYKSIHDDPGGRAV